MRTYIPLSRVTLCALLPEGGADDGDAALVEAVVLAGALARRLEVDGEEQLRPGGVQVHRQSDSTRRRLHAVQSENREIDVKCTTRNT